MSDVNKHMDDAFKKMSEDFKVSYDSSFWDVAKAKLDDANLDDAFRAAANSVVVSPSFSPTESIDDMFMDSAFVEASANQTAPYDSSYFEQFINQEGELLMDEAFTEAAESVSVDYLPAYWSAANQALQNEGLHYEYDSAYWQEARKLLDKSDRKVFFTRWSAVAVVLLLLSFGTTNLMDVQTEVVNGIMANDLQDVQSLDPAANNENIFVDQNSINHISESESVNVNEAESLEEEIDLVDGVSDDINQGGSELTVNGSGSDLLESVSEEVLTEGNPQETTDVADGALELNDTEGSNSPLDRSSESVVDLPGSSTLKSLSKPAINEIAYNKSMPDIHIEKVKPRTMHSISLLAGGGVGNKWGEFSFVPTIRSSVGIEYMTASNGRFRNFEIGTSVMVNHVKQNNLGFEDRITNYNLYGGTTKLFRSVALTNMWYGNANLLVNHRISPRHKMKFGLGVEYLLAVNSNMSYMDGKSNEITIVNNNWGVKEGLNKFDVRFTVGYEYQLSNAFALQLNTNYGMFDRTDDFYLKSNEKNVDIGIMLGVKYNLMRRLK